MNDNPYGSAGFRFFSLHQLTLQDQDHEYGLIQI